MFNKELLNISKPARYIGGEMNAVIKDNAQELLSFCLIFPDTYEIGSSHVGYRLLYELVNKSDKIYCRRFFAPWVDAVETLGSKAFVSLEDKKPLKQFDVLGFSLHYEMSYTTTLAIMKHAGITLRSADRADDEPIIIAGGSCTYNPSILSPFIDAFYIGEGDEGLRNLLEDIHNLKNAGMSKHDILQHINDNYPFMFVPRIDSEKVVLRDMFNGFADSAGCASPVVPLVPAIQDRVAVEIARGCTSGCRFCQAGMIYRPVRERSVELIANDVMNQIGATGHEEVSLLSLSTGDYSMIEPLIYTLNEKLAHSKVSLSTPSLRADSVTDELFAEISKVRKSGFTIAPEAGSERMRKVINKNLTEDDIIKAVLLAVNNDYNAVKLYFMIGLPFETDEDIVGIAELASRIKWEARKIKKSFEVSVSVSHFVPKPHTPFEKFGQVNKLELERRMYMLKEELKKRKLKCKFHDTRMSTVEAVLSRGSKDISEIIEDAVVNKGFYLDAWGEFFDYRNWEALFSEHGCEITDFASKSYEKGEKTPWHNISVGLTNEFFEKELSLAEQEISTPDCRYDACSVCGVCDFKSVKTQKAIEHEYQKSLDIEAEKPIYKKYEFTYVKTDNARFLSALELGRVFIHSLRVAGIKFKYSEGFNPHPKIVLHMPLSVGIKGENEKVAIECETINQDDTVSKLNEVLPRGLNIKSVEEVDSIKSSDVISDYCLSDELLSIFDNAYKSGDAYYERTSKKGVLKKIQIEEYLMGYEQGIISLKATPSGGFNLNELFKRLNVPIEDIDITRLSVTKV